MQNEFANYEKYLKILDRQLSKYFSDQKEFLHCKPGCSICCEWGDYPFSELEMKYAMFGYAKLDDLQKVEITKRIKKTSGEKNNNFNVHFFYECPFLLNNKCSIYEYRPIMCRTYGLIFKYKSDSQNSINKCAECIKHGLNYSSIYDKNKSIISYDLLEKLKIKTKPKAYNIGREKLLNNSKVQKLNLIFGESRSCIDWF